MTFQLHHPESLPPDVLDELLAQGWYRMRQAVFTCRYLLGRRGLYTAVWTRLPLQDYVFRKSLRRRMRKIRQDFDVRLSPWQLDEERAELYRRYRQHVGGDRSDEISEVLHDESERDLFDSWQVSIHDAQGKVVAFSVFDRGQVSLQSIVGVYDPDYKAHGLGMATMLFEVAYGIEQGFQYHYAGYVVPGVSAFDYKRDLGELEYFDPRRDAWLPLSDLDEDTLPAQRLQLALGQVTRGLTDAGIPHEVRCYPPFRVVHMNNLQARCMSSPMFIECGPGLGGNLCLAVTHDPERGGFALEAFLRAEDLADRMSDAAVPEDGPRAESHLLVRMDRTGWTRDPEQVVTWVRRAWRVAGRNR